MSRFIEGANRHQCTLLPELLDDYIASEYAAEDNSVRVIEAFVDELELFDLGFTKVQPKLTGRPAYHPSSLLKIYIYGYLNRVQSSRRLERVTQCGTYVVDGSPCP
jgi:transposase